MKKTLIIIGAVSLGLIAIAIAGATLPADTTTQMPAPATTLSADELYVYAYVGDNLPKLGALYDDLGQACESLDYDGIVTCAEKAIAMSDEWNGIPVVGGNVAALESAYDDAGNGVARLIVDAHDIGTGEAVSNARIERDIADAVDALFACREELDRIAGQYEETF